MFAGCRHPPDSAQSLLASFFAEYVEIRVTCVFRELELWCIVSLPWRLPPTFDCMSPGKLVDTLRVAK
jgi:hypothetical protein